MSPTQLTIELARAAWAVMLELSPWLLLGVAVAGLLHVLLPQDLIRRQLQGRSGVVKAVLLGVPMPLCSCGVIPAGLGLRRDGASRGASVGFLVSTPQTGVDSILVSASFLGWPFALFKVAAAGVTGVVGGWLTDGFTGPEETETDLLEGGRCGVEEGGRGVAAAVDHALDILRSIWRWILLGVVVSAIISVLVPDAWLEGLGALGSLGGALFALAVSLPLYVCATASVPIAAALVAGGMPTGAAIVFLMAGPASNVATLGAVHRTFGRRTLAIYFGTLVVGSIAAGMLFDWLIPPGTVAAIAGHEHDEGWIAVVAAILLTAMLGWFALQDAVRWGRRTALRLRGENEMGEKIEVTVTGMKCDGCVRKVEDALRELEGVTGVIVTLDPGRVEVQGEVDAERVRAVIRDAGFEAA